MNLHTILLISLAVCLGPGTWLAKVRRTAMIRRRGMFAVATVTATKSRVVQTSEPVRIGDTTFVKPVSQVRTDGRFRFTTTEGRVVEFWADMKRVPKAGPDGYGLRYLADDPETHRFTRPRSARRA